MNFGFRYHVASLVAVFFSLILGILIGGALFPDHILVDEQATLISELEERFREVHANLAQMCRTRPGGKYWILFPRTC